MDKNNNDKIVNKKSIKKNTIKVNTKAMRNILDASIEVIEIEKGED